MTPQGEFGVQDTFEQICLKVRPSCLWGASRTAGQDTWPLRSQVFDVMGNDSSCVPSLVSLGAHPHFLLTVPKLAVT